MPNLVFQILLLVFGAFLVVAVLMQHGKSYGLSGTISGGAETFFGKEKGGKIDKILARATTVIGRRLRIQSGKRKKIVSIEFQNDDDLTDLLNRICGGNIMD